jgi:hypothetical protein
MSGPFGGGPGSVSVDPNTGELVTQGVPGLTPNTRQMIKPTKKKQQPKQQPTGVYTADGIVAQNATGDRASGAPVMSQATERRQMPNGQMGIYRNGRLVGVEQGTNTQLTRESYSDFMDYVRANPYGQSVSTGGGSGVGRGVQSGANAIANMLSSGAYGQAYQPSVDALQGLMSGYQSDLASGAYAAPVDAARAELQRQMGVATGNLDASQTALLDYLKNVAATNPFENLKMTAEAVDPQFAALLQQQGAPDTALQAELADIAAGQQAQSGQFGNLVNVLSGLGQAGLSSRQAEAAMADAFARQALANTAAGYQGQFANKQAELQQGLMDRISEGALNAATLQGKIGEARTGLQENLIDLLSKGAVLNPKQMKQSLAAQSVSPKGKGKGKGKTGKGKK